MSLKESLVQIAKKLPFGLSLMCKINEKKVQAKYGDLPVKKNKIIFTNYMGKGFGCNCRPVAEELLRRGYICNLSHEVTLRLLPPLNIDEADLTNFAATLENILKTA